MLDFSSALYLGMRHAHADLRPWAGLTSGRPAALGQAAESLRTANRLAAFLGCERATLAPSTLHLYFDLFDVLADRPIAIYRETSLYQTARWGVERAAVKGVPTRVFPTHDAGALRRLLKRDGAIGRRPVIVVDGVCAANGIAAPLPDYLSLAREQGGQLVIDDTQALGILGAAPSSSTPYGMGGAGTPAFHGVKGAEIILGSSLAKAFGVPVAVLAGAASLVAMFEAESATRVHCSPPSLAVVAAAERALTINADCGDLLRDRLALLVRRFRNGLRRIGLRASGGMFPIQTLRESQGLDPPGLYDRLARLGVTAVLQRIESEAAPALSFLIGAQHRAVDIDRCIEALRGARIQKQPRVAGMAGDVAALL